MFLSLETVIKIFENDEQMKRVKTITDMEKRTFCVDYHCSNLLIFHYSQKQRIANHYLVRDNHLYLQDKSSCITAHTVRKLITRKDNICLAYVSGGMLDYDGKFEEIFLFLLLRFTSSIITCAYGRT